MCDSFIKYANQHKEEIINTFNILHAIPEPAFEETKTARFLCEKLAESGFTISQGFAKTAVLGTYDTHAPGPNICIRADMDALRYEKEGKTVFIHACGHDANCTAVLWAAKFIKQRGAFCKGKLTVLFQPAEETLQGAKAVIESGVLNNIDYMIGTHLRPAEELPMGKVSPAVLHGASGHMKIKVFGQDAHDARPHQGINAILIAANIINLINTIQLDPTIPHSIKPTQIISGTNPFNVIPNYAEVTFDIRAQTNQMMDDVKERIETITKQMGSLEHSKIESIWLGGVPAASKSDRLIEIASDAIKDSLGETALANVLTTSGGEDFHYYPMAIPGLKSTVLGIGAGLLPGLHKADMTFNLDAIINAIVSITSTVEKISCMEN